MAVFYKTLLTLVIGFGFIISANANKIEADTISDNSISNKTNIADKSKQTKSATKMNRSDYIPKFHGTIRARYEYNTFMDAHRFAVRNARVSMTGNVHPIVGYKAEIDLSDMGKINMLDAFVKVMPIKGMSISVGQMKIPFGIENMRSPHNYFFANQAFVGKQFSGHRDAGLTIGYSYKEVLPFTIQGGIYNGDGIVNQKNWQKNINYAFRGELNPGPWLNVILSYHSMKPSEMRMNMYDVGLYSKFYGFHIEAEALYKTYQNTGLKPSYGFNSFVNYDVKLPKVFNKMSFLVRYDTMSDNSDGILSENNTYEIDDYMCHRITGGLTFSIAAPFVADIRINYEKYFYDDMEKAASSEQDKLVLEIVARF